MTEQPAPGVEDLWQVIQEQREESRAQRALVHRQQELIEQLMARLETAPARAGTPRSTAAGKRLSRAGLLRVAALGAGVAALDLGTRQGTALAADGDAIKAGAVTAAESSTTLNSDAPFAPTHQVVFLANDSTYTAANMPYTTALAGITGAGATAGPGGFNTGVFGFADDSDGTGVIGSNSGQVGTKTGSGVLATGLRGTTGLIATSDTGTAIDASGGKTAIRGTTSSTAESVTAIHGVLSANSAGNFSAAVRGESTGTGGKGMGVWGSQAGSGYGVYGTSESGLGIYGTSTSNIGVRGYSNQISGVYGVSDHGAGVKGRGVYGGSFSGTTTQLHLDPGTTSGHPTSGTFLAGDIYLDKAGAMFICTVGGDYSGGTAPTWRQVHVTQPVALAAGWNLLAGPGLSTDTIKSQIDAAGGNVQQIAIYSGGKYVVWVPGHSVPFLVPATAGMYVLTTNPATWTPS